VPRNISLAQLYEDNRENLLLNWVVGQRTDRRIEIKLSNNYGADVVGHINIIHPERMQVMGQAEYDWSLRIGERRFSHQFDDLLAAHPPAVIVAVERGDELLMARSRHFAPGVYSVIAGFVEPGETHIERAVEDTVLLVVSEEEREELRLRPSTPR